MIITRYNDVCNVVVVVGSLILLIFTLFMMCQTLLPWKR